MKSLLKNGREQKGLKTREVAQLLQIDQALVSKFENGLRRPTKEHLIKLAGLYEINLREITILWLKEKILQEIEGEEFGLEALDQIAHENAPQQPEIEDPLAKLLSEVDALRNKIEGIRDAK